MRCLIYSIIFSSFCMIAGNFLLYDCHLLTRFQPKRGHHKQLTPVFLQSKGTGSYSRQYLANVLQVIVRRQ